VSSKRKRGFSDSTGTVLVFKANKPFETVKDFKKIVLGLAVFLFIYPVRRGMMMRI